MNVFDIETKNWNKPYLAGVYDGKKFIYFRRKNCIKQLVNYMIFRGGIWYAHYGGGFDFKFILDDIIRNRKLYIKSIFSNGKFIKIIIYEKKKKLFEMRDSFSLLPCSLSELTKSFKVKHKKIDLDVKNLHKLSFKTQIEYLRADCIGLHEVLIKFKDIIGVQKLKLTVGSQAQELLKTKSPLYKDIKMDWDKEDILRSAYYGGRIEVYKRYGKNLFHYDFKSMYPSIMASEQLPLGRMLQIDHFEKEYMGVYNIRWTSPELYIPLLPLRSKKLMFCNGKGTGWYYSPEIKRALELGYKIDVLNGYIWIKSDVLFKEFVDEYFKKKSSSNGAKRESLKFILNSCYGKFAQRSNGYDISFVTPTMKEFEEKNIICLDKKLNIFKTETKIHNNNIAVQISGIICSYARVKLYNILDKHTYYCDTDCIITSQKIKTSNKLGGISLINKIKEGYFLFPKVYAYKNDKNKKIIRAKGFKKVYYGAYEKALNGDYSDFNEEYEQLVGFLECYTSKTAKSFLSKIKRKKRLRTAFDKRLLVDNINTVPITI